MPTECSRLSRGAKGTVPVGKRNGFLRVPIRLGQGILAVALRLASGKRPSVQQTCESVRVAKIKYITIWLINYASYTALGVGGKDAMHPPLLGKPQASDHAC